MAAPATQVWDVLPHLSGMPTDMARRRLIMTLQVFVDESGKSEPPVFVMAAYVARSEDWAAFSDAWRAILDRPPAMKAFHMGPAVHSGEIRRLPDLMKIVESHVMWALTVTVRHHEYADVMRGRFARLFDTPYVAMFRAMMLSAVQWQIAHDIDEEMDFIFDEQDDVSDRLQSSWSEYRAGLPEVAQRRLVNRPVHLNDVDHPPLQAADMLAWSCRRHCYREARGEPDDDFIRPVFFNEIEKQHMWIRRQDLIYARDHEMANLRRSQQFTPHQMDFLDTNQDFLSANFNAQAIASASTDPVTLLVVQAKGMKRFRLLHTCPRSNSPHLHKRFGDVCLTE